MLLANNNNSTSKNDKISSSCESKIYKYSKNFIFRIEEKRILKELKRYIILSLQLYKKILAINGVK